MDAPLRSVDPLSQPTRAKLFALLAELRRPAGTDELAELLGMHANGIRIHLETLVESGLVARDRERLARGRPRDRWRIAPGAQPNNTVPTGYAELSRWLIRSLIAHGVDAEEIELAGREIGREMAADRAGADAEEALFDILISLGFQPERTHPADDRVNFCFGNCPYRDAVGERPELVCGLHRGITHGLLDGLDPKAELTGFVIKDPQTAGCEVEVRRPA